MAAEIKREAPRRLSWYSADCQGLSEDKCLPPYCRYQAATRTQRGYCTTAGRIDVQKLLDLFRQTGSGKLTPEQALAELKIPGVQRRAYKEEGGEISRRGTGKTKGRILYEPERTVMFTPGTEQYKTQLARFEERARLGQLYDDSELYYDDLPYGIKIL